jgi:hypothetical protein
MLLVPLGDVIPGGKPLGKRIPAKPNQIANNQINAFCIDDPSIGALCIALTPFLAGLLPSCTGNSLVSDSIQAHLLKKIRLSGPKSKVGMGRA